MVRKALRLESWNSGPWEEIAVGTTAQAYPFVLSEGPYDRNVLVIPCKHFIDEPRVRLDRIVVCPACRQGYTMRWIRDNMGESGTWTTTRM
jgi:hypothetical protein